MTDTLTKGKNAMLPLADDPTERGLQFNGCTDSEERVIPKRHSTERGCLQCLCSRQMSQTKRQRKQWRDSRTLDARAGERRAPPARLAAERYRQSWPTWYVLFVGSDGWSRVPRRQIPTLSGS